MLSTLGVIHILRQHPYQGWPSHPPPTSTTVNIFQISHPPSLPTVNNRQHFCFFQPTLPPKMLKENLYIFAVNPPSPTTVNNRQHFYFSRPTLPSYRQQPSTIFEFQTLPPSPP